MNNPTCLNVNSLKYVHIRGLKLSVLHFGTGLISDILLSHHMDTSKVTSIQEFYSKVNSLDSVEHWIMLFNNCPKLERLNMRSAHWMMTISCVNVDILRQLTSLTIYSSKHGLRIDTNVNQIHCATMCRNLVEIDVYLNVHISKNSL